MAVYEEGINDTKRLQREYRILKVAEEEREKEVEAKIICSIYYNT
jgi:hypothetical protein